MYNVVRGGAEFEELNSFCGRIAHHWFIRCGNTPRRDTQQVRLAKCGSVENEWRRTIRNCASETTSKNETSRTVVDSCAPVSSAT